MATELHWVQGPWPGRLAMAARPRGGDWLPDELRQWHASGVDTIVSLLTRDEEQELQISDEADQASSNGMAFVSFPIQDRHVPASRARLQETLNVLDQQLRDGRNIVLHCRQGVGRTGLVASCLLLQSGFEPAAAVRQLSLARGVSIPETEEQRLWIDEFASSLVH